MGGVHVLLCLDFFCHAVFGEQRSIFWGENICWVLFSARKSFLKEISGVNMTVAHPTIARNETRVEMN